MTTDGVTDDIATIRDAIDRLRGIKDAWHALGMAAVDRLEARLAAPCHCDNCLDCLAADGYEAAIERAKQAEQERDEAWNGAVIALRDGQKMSEGWTMVNVRPKETLVALAERADTLERELFAARQAVLTEGLARDEARAEADRLREALRVLAETSLLGDINWESESFGDALVTAIKLGRALDGTQAKEQT